MPGITLTEARIRVLKPRKTAWDLRDGKLRGFGFRIPPAPERFQYGNWNGCSSAP